MTWVKICGTTNLDDALLAVEAGADAVGFVFYERSPRNIEVQTAREIIKHLPSGVEKVGVFVDADCDQIRKVVADTGLSAVQAHGGISGESIRRDPRPPLQSAGVSKIIAMMPADDFCDSSSELNLEQINREKLFAILLDSQTKGLPGGTGQTFDWEAARSSARRLSSILPVIVAGGLTLGNVAEAMKTFQPFGVDVVSGVEANPGKKDPNKVRAFVQAVRDLDRERS